MVGIAMAARHLNETVAPDDLLHLAKALEGMAGALHDCKQVTKEDLEAAALVAHEVWPARVDGHDLHDREYETARHEVRKFAAAAEAGDAKAISWIERSAQHMALALRWKARAAADVKLTPARNSMPKHARSRIIKVLDQRYARYAAHAAIALPLQPSLLGLARNLRKHMRQRL
ncbi:MAG: hypothetical protein V4510_02660 [bacterium]